MKRFVTSLLVVLFCLGGEFGLAQETGKNLLEAVNPAENAIKGDWKKKGKGELQITSDGGSMCLVTNDVGLSYELTTEFTRLEGNDVVAIILPVGGISVALEFSAWQAEAHGIARIDGQTSKSADNPTSVRPGRLENNRRYRVDVVVSQQKNQPTIKVRLNKRKLIDWTGAASRLQPHLVYRLRKANSIGLAAGKGDVVFHNVRLRSAAKTKPTPVPSPGDSTPNKTIDLTALAAGRTPGWEPFNGARFAAAVDGDRRALQSVPSAGSGDRGAFLSGVQFGDGTIEIDLKGANRRGQSFVGIVFHAVDGETYDAIYFRPFNFKASNAVNRSHAVQYISHPQWPWKRLRRERNGQFEKAVVPAPGADDWFHARIELKGPRVRVYVNNSDKPCLDVQKLSQRKTGKIGLWYNGVASFSNFGVSAAGD